MKIFKYSDIVNTNLQQNGKHQFAMNHTMMLYKANAVYSFIPKNACSTMRLSVAIENGCIDKKNKGNWIHSNNNTFIATLGEAVRSEYSFVILRCPFRRLASVFLDKMVSKEPDAWLYRDLLDRSLELDDLSFASFVRTIHRPWIRNNNIHWKPQSDFLLYENYSDYFSLENFSEVVKVLREKLDFEIIDARKLTAHGTDSLELLDDRDYSEVSAFDIATMKRDGKCPSHKSLYTPELIKVVQEAYCDDFALYLEHFEEENLLFTTCDS